MPWNLPTNLQPGGNFSVEVTFLAHNATGLSDNCIQLQNASDTTIGNNYCLTTQMNVSRMYNVSVTKQPHSEVSSLAVFQHMLMDGKEFNLDFDDAIFEVIPTSEGKRVNINEEKKKENMIDN